jgi:hypothetical protein
MIRLELDLVCPSRPLRRIDDSSEHDSILFRRAGNLPSIRDEAVMQIGATATAGSHDGERDGNQPQDEPAMATHESCPFFTELFKGWLHSAPGLSWASWANRVRIFVTYVVC